MARPDGSRIRERGTIGRGHITIERTTLGSYSPRLNFQFGKILPVLGLELVDRRIRYKKHIRQAAFVTIPIHRSIGYLAL